MKPNVAHLVQQVRALTEEELEEFWNALASDLSANGKVEVEENGASTAADSSPSSRFEEQVAKLRQSNYEAAKAAVVIPHTAEERRAALQEIYGKYKGMFSPLDEFLAEKHADNERDEKRYEERLKWRQAQQKST